MANKLETLLNNIEMKFKDIILPDSNIYHLVTIQAIGKILGSKEPIEELRKQYPGFRAVVPLKNSFSHGNIMQDGSQFSNYVQLSSGIIVPEDIALKSCLPFRSYNPPAKVLIDYHVF